MALNAILTAGGRLPKALRAYSTSPVKALLSCGKLTLLGAAAQAAQHCGMLARIAAVGGDEVQQATPDGVEYVREGEDVIDNIYNAFVTLGGAGHDYVIISPDLPFISADGLAAFLAAAQVKAAMAFPLISREDFLTRFPQAKNFFERLDGRRVTMGSMIYMTGPMLQSNIPLGRDFFRYRKLPYKLAGMLGFSIIWGYLTQRLRLSQLEARASRLMGGDVRGVWVSDAGLAYDIDNRENYEYALKRIEAEEKSKAEG
jgi:hypothetical protein